MTTVIKLGELCGAIGAALALISPLAFYVFRYFKGLSRRLDTLEKQNVSQQKSIELSLEERRMLLKGVFACLDGLHQKGCNGQVTHAHNELNNYIINAIHKGETNENHS
ncbi:MAG: hypothetical protein IJ462_01430 [Clostridia bacterium]|nr:hypothetical protein [Clostridia bacterium]